MCVALRAKDSAFADDSADVCEINDNYIDIYENHILDSLGETLAWIPIHHT